MRHSDDGYFLTRRYVGVDGSIVELEPFETRPGGRTRWQYRITPNERWLAARTKFEALLRAARARGLTMQAMDWTPARAALTVSHSDQSAPDVQNGKRCVEGKET